MITRLRYQLTLWRPGQLGIQTHWTTRGRNNFTCIIFSKKDSCSTEVDQIGSTKGFNDAKSASRISATTRRPPQTSNDNIHSVSISSWFPKDILSGRSLALGGSVATVLLLTVFRREFAPAFRWIITQTNSLTDKSIIGQMSIESIATLLAVFLTLYWSFFEYRRTRELEAMEVELSERARSLQDFEFQINEQLEELKRRMEVTELNMEQLQNVYKDLSTIKNQMAIAEAELDNFKRSK